MLYFTPVIKTPLHYLFAHDEINAEKISSGKPGLLSNDTEYR